MRGGSGERGQAQGPRPSPHQPPVPTGTGAFPISWSVGKVKSIAIIYDEGIDTGPDFKGWTYLDNIDINGVLIGQGTIP